MSCDRRSASFLRSARAAADADAISARARVPISSADELGELASAFNRMTAIIKQNQEMEAALKAAGRTAEFIIYPGAPHAFNADYRESYRPEAAKDAWTRCVAWFNKYLKG